MFAMAPAGQAYGGAQMQMLRARTGAPTTPATMGRSQQVLRPVPQQASMLVAFAPRPQVLHTQALLRPPASPTVAARPMPMLPLFGGAPRPPVRQAAARVPQASPAYRPIRPSEPGFAQVHGARIPITSLIKVSPTGTSRPNQTAEVSDVLSPGSLGSPGTSVELKELVARCFAEAAAGKLSLDLLALRQFEAFFCKETEYPPAIFVGMADDFQRFDFDGDNSLQQHECYRLVKHHVHAYRRSGGYDHSRIDVPFKLASADYDIVRKLGEGSQGTVLLAELRSTRSQVCLKKIAKSQEDMVNIDDLKDEFHILHSANNTRIAKVFEMFQDSESFYVVNEPYHGGDFDSLLKKARQNNVVMTEDWWRGLFGQCLDGVVYLHKHALMHCDIKEPNIMLKTNNLRQPDAVIVDFGLAQQFVHPQMKISGTPGYIPPETWSMQKWYPKGDTFCLGVVFAQLVLDEVPLIDPATKSCMKGGIFIKGAMTIEDIFQFTSQRQPDFSAVESRWPGMARVIRGMLEKDTRTRKSAPASLADPWFAGPAHVIHAPPPMGRAVQVGSATAFARIIGAASASSSAVSSGITLRPIASRERASINAHSLFA